MAERTQKLPIVFIGVLVLLIGIALGTIFIPTIIGGIIGIHEETTTTLPSVETTVQSGKVEDEDTPAVCAEPYNITPDTVIFYHSTGCGWCKKMMPLVENLQNESYSFYWADVSDAKSMDVIKSCFKKYMTRGGVPQFICAKNAEIHLGAMPEEDLKKFADECIAGRGRGA